MCVCVYIYVYVYVCVYVCAYTYIYIHLDRPHQPPHGMWRALCDPLVCDELGVLPLLAAASSIARGVTGRVYCCWVRCAAATMPRAVCVRILRILALVCWGLVPLSTSTRTAHTRTLSTALSKSSLLRFRIVVVATQQFAVSECLNLSGSVCDALRLYALRVCTETEYVLCHLCVLWRVL